MIFQDRGNPATADRVVTEKEIDNLASLVKKALGNATCPQFGVTLPRQLRGMIASHLTMQFSGEVVRSVTF